MEEKGERRITAEEIAALLRKRDPDGKTTKVVVRTSRGNVITSEDWADVRPASDSTHVVASPQA